LRPARYLFSCHLFKIIEHNKRFCDFVLKQIHTRLLCKEEPSGHAIGSFNKQKNWVPQEAVELKYLPGYGTFDEALVQCVEEKVKPIWSDLIFEMDLNQNLLLIEDNDHFLDLWLEFLEAVVSSSSLNDVTNMPVSIGRCTFPFSQHIILMVDEIISEGSNLGNFSVPLKHQKNLVTKIAESNLVTDLFLKMGDSFILLRQDRILKFLLIFLFKRIPA